MSAPRHYYLGIDGGQSSTTALVANETGAIVGVGRSGPCNHVTGAEARTKFFEVVSDCLRQATRAIASNPAELEFAAACLGFSGGAEDKTAYSRELVHSARIKVTNDAEIALTGALAGEPGIIVIAGTGSIAFGRNAEGRSARAGGWGYLFGDEGGAFDIVRRALRAVLQQEEGWGPKTILTPKLLLANNSPSANHLLHYLYAQPRNLIAMFGPIVTECANEGDSVAQNILIESARMLSYYVEGVYRNLFRSSERIPVAPIGGVFRSERLRNAFDAQIRTTIGCDTIDPRLSPSAGAVLEALRMDGNRSQLTGIPETKT